MSTYQLGFIGTGNMGGALAQAAAKSGAGYAPVQPHSGPRRCVWPQSSAAQPGRIWRSQKAANTSFSASSPQMLQALLAELKAPLSARTDRPVLVSMGGKRYDQDDQRNAGPPLPGRADHAESAGRAWEGRGSDLPGRYCYGGELTALEEALKPAGLLMRMPEDKLDAGSAVSGCGRRSSICFWTRWQTAA